MKWRQIITKSQATLTDHWLLERILLGIQSLQNKLKIISQLNCPYSTTRESSLLALPSWQVPWHGLLNYIVHNNLSILCISHSCVYSIFFSAVYHIVSAVHSFSKENPAHLLHMAKWFCVGSSTIKTQSFFYEQLIQHYKFSTLCNCLCTRRRILQLSSCNIFRLFQKAE